MEVNSINKILVDSTILIDFSRGHEEAIEFLDHSRENDGEMAISVISSMELIIGCRDKVDLQKTQKFLSEFEIIDISIPISRKTYQLIIQYSKSHGLVIPDAFIAGTALEENLKLVTSNVRHFEMISGVTIQKPY